MLQKKKRFRNKNVLQGYGLTHKKIEKQEKKKKKRRFAWFRFEFC